MSACLVFQVCSFGRYLGLVSFLCDLENFSPLTGSPENSGFVKPEMKHIMNNTGYVLIIFRKI